MGSGGGLEAVLALHEPHTAQGGVFCECGAWERYYDGLGSEETYAAHVAAALAAHLQAVAGDVRAREVVARLMYENGAGGVRSLADAAVAAFVEAVTG